MEMQILSHDAVEQVEKDPEHISIGYFSGSKTHDQDFEVAEEGNSGSDEGTFRRYG